MKNLTHPIKKHIRFFLLISFILTIFYSCEDEETSGSNPAIQFILNADYISSDTIISVGDSIKVGIAAEYNGTDYLTNLIANVNGESYISLGYNHKIIEEELTLVKGLADIEEWEFVVRDKAGHSASIGFTITKNPIVEYGEIDEFLNITLGAQNNTGFGSFLSLSNGLVYNLEEAYNNSGLIDIVYYYDNFDAMDECVLASPGANIGETAFPCEFAIANWDTINTTRYSAAKLSITPEEFDAAANDSILIANSFAFESGKRKAKSLVPDDIYSFVRGNRTGLFKVVSTSGTDNGYIIIDVKIQK